MYVCRGNFKTHEDLTMNTKHLAITLSAIFLILTCYSSFASENKKAGDKSISTIANIMLHLNHYPSPSEKGKLKEIVMNDESPQIKSIATALINLEHKATAGDKAKMEAIINDKSAQTQIRDMAAIIYNLTHKPSSEDKSKLMTMMD